MPKKMKAQGSNGPRVYRDATTGQFVSKKYAKKHRDTTVKGRRKIAPTNAIAQAGLFGRDAASWARAIGASGGLAR